MKNTIKGFWETAVLVCGNHEDEIEMEIKAGPSSLFYACPKYSPDKRSKGEKPCFNRISIKEFEGMLQDIFELLSAEENTVFNITNYAWTRRGIRYKVLSHTDKQIKIQVINPRESVRR